MSARGRASRSSTAFSPIPSRRLVRHDYVDEDTRLGAMGDQALRSQDSATRCPCALNKCENSACAPRVASRRVALRRAERRAPALLLRLLRERRVSYAYASHQTPFRDPSPSLSPSRDADPRCSREHSLAGARDGTRFHPEIHALAR